MPSEPAATRTSPASAGAPKRPSARSNLLVLVVGLVLAFALGEIALRIYNPVRLPLRGQRIVLPTNKRFEVHLPKHPGLDETVHITENTLGFRGREPPVRFDDALTIVAVGGSTTECRYLDDPKTWPARLEERLSETFPDVWVNNAGLHGHSTFGHLQLLDQALLALKPKYLLFLVGVSDMGRTDLNDFDVMLDERQRSLVEQVIEASELLSTIAVLWRSKRAVDLGVEHFRGLELAEVPVGQIDGPKIRAGMAEHLTKYAPGFEARLEKIAEVTRAKGIEPIFVTQPALWGDAADPTSGLNLGPMIDDGETVAQRWQELEIYNGSTRRVGEKLKVSVIDLARKMPKDSRYFYDWIHYTNDGAAFVADTIAADLRPILEQRGHPKR